jgi:hypothetical protein
MGKHFSYDNGSLYIFTTGGEGLLDLNLFPKDLNLFEVKSTWRIAPWEAVIEDVSQNRLEDAQIILRLNGYEKVNVSSRLLDSYFLDGQEVKILQSILIPKMIRVEESPLKEGDDA